MNDRIKSKQTHREPPAIAGRMPPQDLDAEAAVLSACIIERAALDEVADVLDPAGRDFYSDANKVIYSHLVDMLNEGIQVDIVNLASALRSSGKMKQVGGAQYLGEITDASPAVSHVRSHAETIQKLAVVRRTISAMQERTAQGYSVADAMAASQYLDETEQAISKAADVGQSADRAVSLKEGLVKLFRSFQEKTPPGIPTGWRATDRTLRGWKRGNLYIVAARPGMGKTSFAQSLARNAAVMGKKSVVFFSLEMPTSQLMVRMISAEAEIDQKKLRGGNINQAELSMITSKMDKLNSVNLFFDDTPSLHQDCACLLP